MKEIKESKEKLEEFIDEIFEEMEQRGFTVQELEYLPVLLKNKVDIQISLLHELTFKVSKVNFK